MSFLPEYELFFFYFFQSFLFMCFSVLILSFTKEVRKLLLTLKDWMGDPHSVELELLRN